MRQLLGHLLLLSLEVARFLISTAKMLLLPLQEPLIDSPALVGLGNTPTFKFYSRIFGGAAGTTAFAKIRV